MPLHQSFLPETEMFEGVLSQSHALRCTLLYPPRASTSVSVCSTYSTRHQVAFSIARSLPLPPSRKVSAETVIPLHRLRTAETELGLQRIPQRTATLLPHIRIGEIEQGPRAIRQQSAIPPLRIRIVETGLGLSPMLLPLAIALPPSPLVEIDLGVSTMLLPAATALHFPPAIAGTELGRRATLQQTVIPLPHI